MGKRCEQPGDYHSNSKSKRDRINRVRQRMAQCLLSGTCVAQTKRALSFDLQGLVEGQLRLFYAPLFSSVPGRVRLEAMLETCMFGIRESLSKLSHGVYAALADEKARQQIMEQNQNHLAIRIQAAQVLGVSMEVDRVALRKAYHVKAREAHPDLAGGNTDRMQQLNIAYAVLLEALDENEPGQPAI